MSYISVNRYTNYTNYNQLIPPLMDDLAGKPLWPGGKIHGILETDLDWSQRSGRSLWPMR